MLGCSWYSSSWRAPRTQWIVWKNLFWRETGWIVDLMALAMRTVTLKFPAELIFFETSGLPPLVFKSIILAASSDCTLAYPETTATKKAKARLRDLVLAFSNNIILQQFERCCRGRRRL